MGTMFIEDDRFTAAEAQRESIASRRAANIKRLSRKVMLTLAPGELHPRDRIAHLERELQRTEEERVELAATVLSLRSQLAQHIDPSEIEA